MVWSFLSHVLRDGRESSCEAAVAREFRYCEAQGLDAPTEDTSHYCRARAKLSEGTLRELGYSVAEELERADDPRWLVNGKDRAKLIDGFQYRRPVAVTLRVLSACTIKRSTSSISERNHTARCRTDATSPT